MARIELTDDAKDDIRGLDRSVQARILRDLKKLEDSPSQRGAPLGSRKSGNLTGLRKLYIGPSSDYRAVFAADGDTVAVVMVVAKRAEEECYQLAVARLRLLSDAKDKNEVTALLMSLVRGGD
jgi:mRNA interferase RelE/StbE